MAFILVQYWAPLPPIPENQMGDVPPGGGQPSGAYPTSPSLGPSASGLIPSGQPDVRDSSSQHYVYPSSGAVPQIGQSAFPSQSQQQQYYHNPLSRQNPHQTQSNVTLQHMGGRPSALNMASLGSALPEITYGQSYGQQSSQRFPHQPPVSLAYQQPQQVQYPPQFQTVYQSAQSPQSMQPSHTTAHQFYAGQPFVAQNPQQQLSPYFFQQGQFASQGQTYPGNPYPSQYAGRMSIPNENALPGRQPSNERLGQASGQGSGSLARAGSTASSSGHPSVPRGPPRKPKQSGHALWVGNLPPGANVVDLKDHFSRDATNDILSVFLISKSNCAFVNYKTEESCAAAMTRFHDSRFQGVRLVCRLRRTSVNVAPGAPTGPAALSAQSSGGKPSSPEEADGEVEGSPFKTAATEQNSVKEKFFIVKSLTVEDLELSVRNCIWATQSHNEESLNKAYVIAEAVYLIFSANKSGEYFGYARMISPINDDPAAAIEFAPKAQVVEDPDLPKAIPTPATEFAANGRIIDDSARGTIFWEAETDAFDEVDGDDSRSINNSDQEGEGDAPKAWGKPFKVEWLSTNRLPFYRTRGLRNPWNSNREVKIARDGTELETSIGRRLVQMFHREASPVASSIPPMQLPPMMGGYPSMRPF